jgi:hypothetical protein
VGERVGEPSNSNVAREFVADNFVVTEAAVLSRVIFWGFYGNAPMGPPEGEKFRVAIATDASGAPGAAVVPALTQFVAQRTPFPIGMESIFRYVIDLPPVVLTSGTYWIAITSEGPRGSGQGGPPPDEPSFYWQRGQLDDTRGIADAASISLAQPIWVPFSGEFAVELCGPPAPPEVPALGRRGALLLTGMLALVAWPLLRKGRAANTD